MHAVQYSHPLSMYLSLALEVCVRVQEVFSGGKELLVGISNWLLSQHHMCVRALTGSIFCQQVQHNGTRKLTVCTMPSQGAPAVKQAFTAIREGSNNGADMVDGATSSSPSDASITTPLYPCTSGDSQQAAPIAPVTPQESKKQSQHEQRSVAHIMVLQEAITMEDQQDLLAAASDAKPSVMSPLAGALASDSPSAASAGGPGACGGEDPMRVSKMQRWEEELFAEQQNLRKAARASMAQMVHALT